MESDLAINHYRTSNSKELKVVKNLIREGMKGERKGKHPTIIFKCPAGVI